MSDMAKGAGASHMTSAKTTQASFAIGSALVKLDEVAVTSGPPCPSITRRPRGSA